MPSPQKDLNFLSKESTLAFSVAKSHQNSPPKSYVAATKTGFIRAIPLFPFWRSSKMKEAWLARSSSQVRKDVYKWAPLQNLGKTNGEINVGRLFPLFPSTIFYSFGRDSHSAGVYVRVCV